MAASEPQPQTHAGPLIRNISDTARWVAVYRARETERPDAVFRDPFARRLAGDRGEQIANSRPVGRDTAWSMVARTYMIDKLVRTQVEAGVDMVINLAAGLDSRPYRLQLPTSLRWIEIDLPEILTYKEEILANEKPVCSLERIRLDLSNATARREVFAQLASKAKNALVITEGLVIYLSQDEVGSLAQDLAAQRSFRYWIVDVASPALLRMLKKRMNAHLSNAAPFQFAPEDGAKFFEKFGWKEISVNSMLKTAAAIHRLPLLLRFFALFPETEKSRRDRPWSGIYLFGKS
jgi:methyltransferase (TIGR00027 family)